MIAIDTNVLLRYLTEDDEDQAAKARQLILGNETVLITDVVLVEMVWVLTGKRYQLAKEGVIDVLHALFAEPNIRFEDDQAVWCALKDYVNAVPVKIKGKYKQADFPDALVINKAKRYGELNGLQVSAIYTFDKAAQTINGTLAP